MIVCDELLGCQDLFLPEIPEIPEIRDAWVKLNLQEVLAFQQFIADVFCLQSTWYNINLRNFSFLILTRRFWIPVSIFEYNGRRTYLDVSDDVPVFPLHCIPPGSRRHCGVQRGVGPRCLFPLRPPRGTLIRHLSPILELLELSPSLIFFWNISVIPISQ